MILIFFQLNWTFFKLSWTFFKLKWKRCNRGDTVVLLGFDLPVGDSTENCNQVAIEILKSNLKVNINPGDISVANRIGKQHANSPDRLKILKKTVKKRHESWYHKSSENYEPFKLLHFWKSQPTKSDLLLCTKTATQRLRPNNLRKHNGRRNKLCLSWTSQCTCPRRQECQT